MFRAPTSHFTSIPEKPLDHGGNQKRVAILGAGLAGLSAAHRLHEAGHEVMVLEARDRPGGRIETIREPFSDGLYAEAGAVFIPPWHTLVREYAKEFGLDLTPMPPAPLTATSWYLKGGRVVGPSHPASALPVELSEEEAKEVDGNPFGIFVLFQRYLPQELMNTLQDWGGGPPIPAELRHYDDQSFLEYLESKGASPGAIAILRLGYLDLMGEGIESVSALLLLRDFALNSTPPHLRIRTQAKHIATPKAQGGGAEGEDPKEAVDEAVEAYTITGGNDHLPRAFAHRLEGVIRYQTPVVRVEVHPGGVSVICGGPEGRQQFDADRAICTLPFSILRGIEFDPPLSQEKASAIENLPHTRANRTYVSTATRTWTPPEPVGGEGSLLYGSGNTDLLGQWLHDATAFQPGTPGIVEAYRAGGRASAVEGMTDESRREATVASLTRVYPGIQVVDGHGAYKSWTQDPWSQGGYCWFRPGQMQNLMPHIATAEGRIHFAGDHTSPAPGWMEGALESGHRAANEVNEAD